LGKPRFLGARRDVFALADRAAWGEEDAPLDPAGGGRLFDALAGLRKPVDSAPQVVHGDLFGTVLFEPGEGAALIDFVPYWRPAEWAAAVVVVDALAWGGSDEGIVRRWEHLPEWPQSLLYALLFRLAVHALHPLSGPESLRGLERASKIVTDLL
jgi:uncharacterized protein (TIGR02569 family)